MTYKTFFVEDNATIRDNLIATLTELSDLQAVGFADTEAAALEWLAGNADWQLLVVDLWLRQGSGMGVLSATRERRPDQRVVVLSNYATADMRKRCAELGADAVFDKSNEIDALLEYCGALGR